MVKNSNESKIELLTHIKNKFHSLNEKQNGKETQAVAEIEPQEEVSEKYYQYGAVVFKVRRNEQKKLEGELFFPFKGLSKIKNLAEILPKGKPIPKRQFDRYIRQFSSKLSRRR